MSVRSLRVGQAALATHSDLCSRGRAPVFTRDCRGNELQRHYYASVDACIDPSVDCRERAMGKPVNRRPGRDESPFAEQDVDIEQGVRSLLDGGESAVVEFKSTARCNLHTGAPDPAIAWAVIKTIAAFMNTHGGTLLVGVDDHGRPVGIERDYPFVKGRARDGWELWLTTVVKTALGTIAATDLLVRFCAIDDGTLARIDVRPGVQPVFATRKDGPREVFFARLNNSTEELSGPALLDYRQKHWPE